MIANIQHVLFIVFVVDAAAIICCSAVFNRNIRKNYPDIWEKLGKPNIFNSSFNTQWEYAKLIFGSQYNYLIDRQLSKKIWFMRILSIATYILFFSIFVVLALSKFRV